MMTVGYGNDISVIAMTGQLHLRLISYNNDLAVIAINCQLQQ